MECVLLPAKTDTLSDYPSFCPPSYRNNYFLLAVFRLFHHSASGPKSQTADGTSGEHYLTLQLRPESGHPASVETGSRQRDRAV